MTLSTGAGARCASRGRQRGGFILGMILGLLLGLGIALGVALYIAKVPVPFVDKVGHRTAEQDATETERLKTWDPNAGLANKSAPRPALSASNPASAAGKAGDEEPAAAPAPTRAASRPAAVASSPTPSSSRSDSATSTSSTGTTSSNPAAPAAKSTRDPAAILAGADTVVAKAPAPAAAPVAATRPAASSGGGNDPYLYFVQAGAYSNSNDAEQQRARLAIQGLVAKVTEREQAGRTVYRVRLGPFNTRDEADLQTDKLKAAGAESTVVRVDKPKP